MIHQRFAMPLAALLIGLAGLAGILSSSVAQATTVNAFVWVNPGGGQDHLNCGWHGQCGPTPSAGVGLDFRNNGGASVYFRSFGARLSGSGTIGTGQAVESDDTCYRVRVEIRDPNSTFRASAIYTHTDQPQGGTFNIVGGPLLSPTYTIKTIGKTRSTPKSGCAWTAAHLHQHGQDFASRNTSVYPGYVNAQDITASLLTNWVNTDSYSFTE